jgi:hypothetical protein
MPTPEAVRLMHKLRTYGRDSEFALTDEHAAEEIDRFAAQRGAERMTELPRSPHKTNVDEWLAELPQTGGGDVGERAREDEWFALLVRKYVQRSDERQRQMGLQYTEAETRDLANVCARHEAAALRSSRREEAETISDDMNAAHWHGYREGAEAMRHLVDAISDFFENIASVTTHTDEADAAIDDMKAAIDAIRTLPIPGSKTDAG